MNVFQVLKRINTMPDRMLIGKVIGDSILNNQGHILRRETIDVQKMKSSTHDIRLIKRS